MFAEVRDTLEADQKALDSYKESYDCIKEVAELDDVDAIVGKFLSQEAENFALFNYVTELNGENEILAEEVHKIEMDIQKMKEEQKNFAQQTSQELELLEVST